VGYQILALIILETGAFLPEKVKQEVLRSTTWKNDRQWGWSPDLLIPRKHFLKEFRRALRSYHGEKVIVEKIPSESKSLLEKFFSVGDFIKYLNVSNTFRKFLKALSVKFLYLDMNNLETIPYEVFLCGNLIELSLSHNSLTELPKEIGCFPRLKKLILSHNKLIHLPDEVANLKSLEVLWVDHNRLNYFPKSLGSLRLEDFDFSSNPF
jgi:hypothetical protein